MNSPQNAYATRMPGISKTTARSPFNVSSASGSSTDNVNGVGSLNTTDISTDGDNIAERRVTALSLAALKPEEIATLFRSDRHIWRREIMSMARDMGFIMSSIAGPLCRKHDLTQQQLIVLLELAAEPRQRPSRISDKLGILRTNFTSICHKLEKRQLICRMQSTDDRRAYILQLTDEGHALLHELDAELNASHQAAVDDIPDDLLLDIIRGWQAMQTVAASFAKGHSCSDS